MLGYVKSFLPSLGANSFTTSVIDGVKTSGLACYYQAYAPKNAGTKDYQTLRTIFNECSRNPHTTAKISSRVKQQFYSLPSNIRYKLYNQIHELAGKPKTANNQDWGKRHLFDQPKRLANAVKQIAFKKFDSLDAVQKESIGRQIAISRGKSTPNDTVDLMTKIAWGKRHAKDDAAILLNCFHSSPALYDYEATLKNKSSLYSLGRKELPKGQISYINGMNTPLDRAKGNAFKFSKDIGRNYNFHCVHAATNGKTQDYHEIVLLRNGVITNPARLLHKRWDNFFDKCSPKEKFLQICFSKGASHVRAALESYKSERRKRIVVLALAPAELMPKGLCHRVTHIIKKNDGVPFTLPGNAARIAKKETDIVLLAKGSNPHNPHAADYTKAASKEVDRFLTQDCGIKLRK